MYIDISVIIPVYNPPHDMFEKCIGSLLSQTGELGLEFIFVNDGSTDGWIAERLERLEQEDKRVVVITKENEGVSVARNTGIDKAKGEYIAFVDHDDYMLDGGLEYMHRVTAREKAQIGVFGYIDEKHIIATEPWNDIIEGKKKNEMIKELVVEHWEDSYFKLGFMIVTLWAKLYRRDFIQEQNIRLVPGLVFDDDGVFNLEALGKAERIVADTHRVYYYAYYCNSQSNLFRQEYIPMLIIAMKNKKRLIEEMGRNTEEMKEALTIRAFLNVLKADIAYLCETRQKVSLSQRHRDLSSLVKDDILAAYIRKLSIDILKKYSIYDKSLMARLFIYKYKLVWILTAKTWIKQRLLRR